MKTKRSRKDYSDDDSDEPEETWPAAPVVSSSDFLASSDGEVSKKNKKRRKKRESSSESESDGSDRGSHKKKKHKKKKRKHSKKKRKEASSDDSESDSEDSSDASEESPVVKKKHKHKHRHSGKHSKKRRHDSDGEMFPEKVAMSSDRAVQQRPSQGHKMKSVCMGKEPRQSSVENIVSSEEEQARTRSGRREDTDRNTYKSRVDNREAHDHHRIKYPATRPHQPEAGKSGEQPRHAYKESSRIVPPTDKYQSVSSREKFEAGKYNTDKPQRNPDQYYDNTKPRDDRPKDFRVREDRSRDARLREERSKEERPREEREFPAKYPDNNYNRYGDGNRQNFDRNGGNKFPKNKFEEGSREDRFAGQSSLHYKDTRDVQGERFEDRQQGFNRRSNNYPQQQNYQQEQRHEGGYQKSNEYHNPRNDQRGNRYQDKADYSGGNLNTTRRYESRDANERTHPVKREHSASSNRDVKQERRSDSRRAGSRERAPRAEFKREEREVSGATARSRDRLRGSPDRSARTRGSQDRPARARGSPERPARTRGSPERPARTRGSPEPDMDKLEWGKPGATDKRDDKPQDRDKPNFGLSGKLTEDRNTVNGVVLKYSEPPEARQPKRRWRFYPFKGDKALSILYIHRQSCFLLGRDRKVCDIPLDHPSVSKQHAALQYRLVPFTREDGSKGKRVRPYIIDLGSANGTFVNNKKVDPSKYVELLERDVVKFGFSQREYVLLHENSKDDGMDDDDVKQGNLSDEGKARVKEEVSN